MQGITRMKIGDGETRRMRLEIGVVEGASEIARLTEHMQSTSGAGS